MLSKIARTLGFEGIATWNSFNYLGIPIVKGKKRVPDWQGMIDKTKNKINSWGIRWLNPARKLILINSILSAYPSYSFSISLAPKKTMKEFTREIKKNSWQGGKSDSLKKNSTW